MKKLILLAMVLLMVPSIGLACEPEPIIYGTIGTGGGGAWILTIMEGGVWLVIAPYMRLEYLYPECGGKNTIGELSECVKQLENERR